MRKIKLHSLLKIFFFDHLNNLLSFVYHIKLIPKTKSSRKEYYM